MSTPAPPVTVAFVLASYRPDEPAGWNAQSPPWHPGCASPNLGNLTFISWEIQTGKSAAEPVPPRMCV